MELQGGLPGPLSTGPLSPAMDYGGPGPSHAGPGPGFSAQAAFNYNQLEGRFKQLQGKGGGAEEPAGGVLFQETVRAGLCNVILDLRRSRDRARKAPGALNVKTGSEKKPLKTFFFYLLVF